MWAVVASVPCSGVRTPNPKPTDWATATQYFYLFLKCTQSYKSHKYLQTFKAHYWQIILYTIYNLLSIQNLSLCMFLDFNARYCYLNPIRPLISVVWVRVGCICCHRCLLFNVGSFCIIVEGPSYWPWTWGGGSRLHVEMLKSYTWISACYPLSPQTLILDKRMEAWHTCRFFSVSKPTHTRTRSVVWSCGEVGNLLWQSIPGISFLFPLSYSSATLE